MRSSLKVLLRVRSKLLSIFSFEVVGLTKTFSVLTLTTYYYVADQKKGNVHIIKVRILVFID